MQPAGKEDLGTLRRRKGGGKTSEWDTVRAGRPGGSEGANGRPTAASEDANGRPVEWKRSLQDGHRRTGTCSVLALVAVLSLTTRFYKILEPPHIW